jgi:hypothetical protein
MAKHSDVLNGHYKYIQTNHLNHKQLKIMEKVKSKLAGAIALIIISSVAYGQKLGIKPLIGYTFNGVGASYYPGNIAVFTEAEQFNPLITGGLFISYQTSPTFGVEIGMQNIATSINYRIFNISNSETVGEMNVAIQNTYYHIGFTKLIKEINKTHKIKGTCGINFYTLDNSATRGRQTNYRADTNFVTESGYVGNFLLNGFNDISWGMTGGIADEIYIKGKQIGEFRFIARYNFRPTIGAFSKMRIGNEIYTNEYISNRLTFETSLLINLSSILGNKWRN